jgi:hypothetical protein
MTKRQQGDVHQLIELINERRTAGATPAEGLRLMQAFLQIGNPASRDALVHIAEALAASGDYIRVGPSL